MALVRALYGRVEHLIHEVAKFGIVGGISYVVTVIANYAYLFFEKNDEITAYIVANVVATGVAYLGNRYWTYKERESGGGREMALFVAINGIAIAIQAGIATLTTYVLHMNSHVEIFFSKFVLGIAIGMAFRFWCYRTFIFPETEPALASDEFQYSEPLPTSQIDSEAPRSGSGALLSKTR
ncbi:MAG TPA: GtrA family protein [Actinospica sp.]|nr:GtrA family protein [Actinospica sp.]